MVLLKTFFVTLTTFAGVFAVPFDAVGERYVETLKERSVPATSQGYHNGYFYAWWSDGIGNATFNLGEDSRYSVEWDGISSFYGGIGWNPGTGRSVFVQKISLTFITNFWRQNDYLRWHFQPYRQCLPFCLWLHSQPPCRVLCLGEPWYIQSWRRIAIKG
jgi:hypothetical protein